MGKTAKTANPTPKRRTKSPTRYSWDLAKRICERISNGETLMSICRDPAMPNRSTVNDWTLRNSFFNAQYENARKQSAHTLADMAIEEIRSANDRETAYVAQVKANTYFKRASQLLPSMYNDKAVAARAFKQPALSVNVGLSNALDQANDMKDITPQITNDD